MMKHIMWRQTDHTTHTTHQLLKITSKQIKHLDHVELQKSWCRYLENVEDKYAEKNCTGTDHLVWIFRKGGGQICREELHRHRPFGSRMRLVQSHIQ